MASNYPAGSNTRSAPWNQGDEQTCLECGETVPDAEAPGENDPPVTCRRCKLIDSGKCVECENAKSSQDRFQDRCVSCRLLEDR